MGIFFFHFKALSKWFLFATDRWKLIAEKKKYCVACVSKNMGLRYMISKKPKFIGIVSLKEKKSSKEKCNIWGMKKIDISLNKNIGYLLRFSKKHISIFKPMSFSFLVFLSSRRIFICPIITLSRFK